jgi:hypothetical protein
LRLSQNTDAGHPGEAASPRVLKLKTAAPQVSLLVLAVWIAWRPAETHPWSSVFAATIVLALTAWGWRRVSPKAEQGLVTAAIAGCVLTAAGLLGWDPASAIRELWLFAALIVIVWLASREMPSDHHPAVLAVLLSGLAIWGIWQVGGGLERAGVQATELPTAIQAGVIERVASGRAFASQLLPSHLAVLLATALPLLLIRIRPRWQATPWIAGAALCVVGLVLTRSPVGAALALAACVVLTIARKSSKRLLWVVLILLLALAVVTVWRGDVMELEPVSLRLDNWRTSLWVWSSAPAAGVGPGGFAQASQAVPFEVGNRPRHAHSLPLELLAELGPVGLAAFLFGAWALWRLVRDLWPLRPELAVAVVVIPLHNLVDFSLFGSGVALPWAVLLGWAIAFRQPTAVPDRVPRGRLLLVVVATLALAATILDATSRTVEVGAAAQSSPDGRLLTALQARRLAPWRLEPVGLAATSALETGDRQKIAMAAKEIDQARRLRPHSAALAGLRARLGLALGEGPTAVSEAWNARHGQPANAQHAVLFDEVLQRLDPGANRESR